MSFWPKAKHLKYLASASFLSLVVGMLAFFYELRSGRTNLTVDVTAESNVLDVRTSVPELAVLFRGQDIQQENLNLKILAVRLSNDGEVNILESHFDSRIPWGLQIDWGRIVAVRITGSNSRYLSDNLQPILTDGSHIIFNKLIIDKAKYITLELLVLHNKSIEPQVRIVGKIAGMDQIAVTSSFKEHDRQGLLRYVFKGPITVQIARTIAYFVVGLVAILTVGFSIAGLVGIRSQFQKRSRRRVLRYLPKAESPEEEFKRQAVLEIYVEQGVDGLKRALAILTDERHVKMAFGGLNARRQLRQETGPFPADDVVAVLKTESMIHDASMHRHLESLIRGNLVRADGKSVEVDPKAVELVAALIRQLSDANDTRSAVECAPGDNPDGASEVTRK